MNLNYYPSVKFGEENWLQSVQQKLSEEGVVVISDFYDGPTCTRLVEGIVSHIR